MPIGLKIGGELAADLALVGVAPAIIQIGGSGALPPGNEGVFLSRWNGAGTWVDGTEFLTPMLDPGGFYLAENGNYDGIASFPMRLEMFHRVAVFHFEFSFVGYLYGEAWRLSGATPERLVALTFIHDLGNNWRDRSYTCGGLDWCEATGECWMTESFDLGNRDGEDVTFPLRIHKSGGAGSAITLMHSDAGYTVVAPTKWPVGFDPTNIEDGYQVAHVARGITVSADGQRIFVPLEPPNFFTNSTGGGGVGGFSFIRSLDGGATWDRQKVWRQTTFLSDDGGPYGTMPFGYNGAVFDDFRYGPNDVLFVPIFGQLNNDVPNNSAGCPTGFYYSVDDGHTWQESTVDGLGLIDYFYPSGFAVPTGDGLYPAIWPSTERAYWQPSWGNLMFHLVLHKPTAFTTSGSDILRSTDGGITWTTVVTTAAGIDGEWSMDYDPLADKLYLAGGAGDVWVVSNASGTPSAAFVAGVDGPPQNGPHALAVSVAGEPIAHIADAASREMGELAIILAGTNLAASVYYTDDVLGDGSHWKRAVGAPVRDDGTWIVPDTQPGRFLFGFHDDKIYQGDVSAGVMTATLAAGTLSGDVANHAVWIGGFVDTIFGGCYLIAADGGIYQTWDRGATVQKVRPATGFPALPAGAHPKMLSLSKPAV